MAIRCCYGCVAPKRHPGCHDSCKDYLEEKAKHDAEKEAEYKERSVRSGLTSQRFRGVNRAEKNKRRQKGA